MTSPEAIRELKSLFEGWAVTISGGGCLALLLIIENDRERLLEICRGHETRLTLTEEFE